MATNRTATAKWKNLRRRVITTARGRGQNTCPLCHRILHWDTYQQPLSPEVDHIIPVSRGGTDDETNLRVICRHCNGSRGNREDVKTPGGKYITHVEKIGNATVTHFSDGSTGTNLIDW